ncbi:malto-oligosyltrehalose trehalohydrolase [Pendulispora rubella]|uniref:Malto-oligosyltrehalose trehalohydrolase n=1 Tax=Pendulispora rubella TaxID=2741070 RepID=A0ABZ2L7X6_9BACT
MHENLLPLGSIVEKNGTRFRAWVTTSDACAVRLYGEDGQTVATHAMTRSREASYFEAFVDGVGPGALYKFVVGGRELPDPYARFLPRGVHGPAMVTAPNHAWKHGEGIARPLEEQVLYEVHVGTFTAEGTYDAARARLPELVELGVTTVELMPLAAFPGARNWGYDGVALYAPFAGYGTPDDLRRFVDEAHGLGLGVFLDVVYNHFGPSGNYLAQYCPKYFTKDADTPWGEAPNFAFEPMRRYVVDNARYWLSEFRFDGLRLDATQAIHDPSAYPILRELSDRVAELAPRKVLIGEDDRNDPALMRELGLDAVWTDDFHHQVHASLTGERDGYYRAYEPGLRGIADTISGGWLYQGAVYQPTGKPRGKSDDGLPGRSFVYYLQNHDQVGNRGLGDRLSDTMPLDTYCAVSMLFLLLPMTPLLFMGQEWAASTPFLYFTDHEAALGRAITKGRREEFKTFEAFSHPAATAAIPDPQKVETFERSRLRWEERGEVHHARVQRLYRELIAMRRSDAVFRRGTRERLTATVQGELLVVRQWLDAEVRVLLVNFADEAKIADASITGLRPMASSGAALTEGRVPARTAILFGSS